MGICMTKVRDAKDEPFRMPYDVLVVAVGVRPSSFGVPGVYENCLFMKGIEDARNVRRRIVECFEMADLPGVSLEERKRLLTFTVVGGGPTGCEFCGELSDFVRNDLRTFYPELANLVRVLLVQNSANLLPSFSIDLQLVARETLSGTGIEILTSTRATAVASTSITLMSADTGEVEKVPCGLCVWAAGNRGQQIVEDLIQKIPGQQELVKEEGRGNTSRLFIDGWNRVAGVPDGSLLAMGDCARLAGSDPLPQTAQVAAQQGAYLARLLNRKYELDTAAPKLPASADSLQAPSCTHLLPPLVTTRLPSQTPIISTTQTHCLISRVRLVAACLCCAVLCAAHIEPRQQTQKDLVARRGCSADASNGTSPSKEELSSEKLLLGVSMSARSRRAERSKNETNT